MELRGGATHLVNTIKTVDNSSMHCNPCEKEVHYHFFKKSTYENYILQNNTLV